MNKNFENSLPENYSLALHIDSKNKKTGLIFNLCSVVIAIVVAVALILPRGFSFDEFMKKLSEGGEGKMILRYLVFIASMILYMVLHEIVHGIAYKCLTHQKLTFGMSWSCAFCGVPNIYVYRRTAMISLIMPFAVFSAVYGALIAAFAGDIVLYSMLSLLFALHLGGCICDVYTFVLFMFKYKDKAILMRDTGPEQFLYVKQ